MAKLEADFQEQRRRMNAEVDRRAASSAAETGASAKATVPKRVDPPPKRQPARAPEPRGSVAPEVLSMHARNSRVP